MSNNSKISKLYVFFATLFILLMYIVTISFSLDRYDTFVYGKFDLGNMNQMLYNSARGDFMIITDYFGQNVPRWAMSHVDPSLLIFIPVSWFFSDASFLLIAQTTAFLVSSILIYFISKKEGLSNIVSINLALLVFLMPISGFILVWTTFHSLILAMPFLLLSFLLLLLLEKNPQLSVSNRRLLLFIVYISFLLVVLSKEEIGFIVFCLGPFFWIKFKSLRKHVVIISIFSLVWSLVCFLYIIPHFSNVRNEGITKFIDYVGGVDDDSFLDYSGQNYFLYRYSDFGDSYSEIAKNLIFKPGKTFEFIFSQSNLSTLNKIFLPVGYLVFLSPLVIFAASPEIAIQILTGDPTVFSIENHRLLIVIPIMLLSLVYTFKFLIKFYKYFALIISTVLVLLNLYLGVVYKNPLIYPFYDKLFASISANNNTQVEFYNNIRPECAQFMVDQTIDYSRISSPQPLGAKTSNRNFNALFPAGLDTADIVIADIYARKLVDFMDVSTKYNILAVKRMLNENNVVLKYSCDRFFLLSKSQKNEGQGTIEVLDNFEKPPLKIGILEKSNVYSFDFHKKSDDVFTFTYTYEIGDEADRKSLFAYTVLVPTDGAGKNITFVHFPSYYLLPLNNVPVQSVLQEAVEYRLPTIYKNSSEVTYDVYFGIGNREKNEENVLVGQVKF